MININLNLHQLLMEPVIPSNQISPSIRGAQDQNIKDTDSEVDVINKALTVFSKLKGDSNPAIPNIASAAPKWSAKTPSQLLENDMLHNIRLSPDGAYLANLSASTLTVFCTKSWTILCSAELEDENMNVRSFDVDCPPFFFFPDSKYIGLTGIASFTIYSIREEQFIAELQYSKFKQFGVAYHENSIVSTKEQKQEITQSTKYFKFYNFFDLEGYQDSPRGVLRNNPKPRMLAIGTNMAIFMVDLYGWDYESPLDQRGYWMCPLIYDRFRTSSTYSTFDGLGLFATQSDEVKILRFPHSFYEYLELNLRGESTDRLSEKSLGQQQKEIKMIVEELPELCGEATKFDSSEISPGAEEYLVLTSRNKLVSVNLFDSKRLKVYEFPEFTEDLGEPRSILGGKYLMMINSTANRASFFILKDGKYHHMLRLDEYESYPSLFYLSNTHELLIFKNGKPWTFSLELIAHMEIQDMFTSKVRNDFISFKEKLTIYHEYFTIPEHGLIFCKLESYESLFVSDEGGVFAKVDLEGQRA
jgi:hypothetical protein